MSLPAAPDYFSEEQRARWAELLPTLPASALAPLRIDLVAAYVLAEDRHRQAARKQAELDAGSALPMMIRRKEGGVAPSPYLAVMQRASQEMARLAVAIGTRATPARTADAADITEADGEDAALADGVLVSKRELCRVLRISRPTLDAWIDRYGDAFPIAERGANGREYQFDAEAVIDFLRAEQERQAAARAQRDEALAQLMLPLPAGPAPAADAPSLDDRLKAARLNALLLDEEERAGRLVSATEVEDRLTSVFAVLARELAAFLRQLAREQNWPDAVLLAAERRLAEVQHTAVTAASAPAPDERRLAFG